jgi:hypothetical protein
MKNSMELALINVNKHIGVFKRLHRADELPGKAERKGGPWSKILFFVAFRRQRRR